MRSKKFRDLIDDFFESEKYRLPNFIPVGIGIGISLYFSLNNEPNFLFNSGVFILILLINALTKSDKWIGYILLTISMGFFFSQLRTKTVNTFMLSEENKKPISLVATVESCEKTKNGLTFIVSSIKSKKYRNLNKLHLSWRGKKAISSQQDYIPGSKILFRTILSPLQPQSFPGAYDFKKQQYFKGISARGFITAPPKILENPDQTSLELFIEQLRHRIDKKIEKCLPQETASIAKALITGNKSEISQSIRNNFANSGIAHLLAISGLHMGIIGFFVFWIFRIFLCCFPSICMFFDIKKISAIISWIVVLFYLYISGKSVPSVRAFIMHTIVICAILVERCSITMRSVAIAATLVMISTPEVILFPSFQMSFGAVIAIVALHEHNWNFSGLFRNLFGVLGTTVVASIPTAIFSMYTFNQLTLNSIFANVISIPFMSFFIMPMAIIALFLMLFDLAQPLIVCMGYGIQALVKISELSAQLPGSRFVMPTPTYINMAIFIFSGLILTLIHHKIRFCGAIGMIIGGIYYYFNTTPDILISQKSKLIGIKTDEALCFNHLGYFRSMALSWMRSLGMEKRERFDSKACRKYITKISEDTYSVNLKGKSLIFTGNRDYFLKSSDAIFLDKCDNFASIIYFLPRKCISNGQKFRPWS
ncbi:MAG: competence protein ComEC family protein [Holosporaceae bacterium]|jgi:competence protein ComEC|nr:competence protein ComEC family protein [Holosporaceae bacterium]